MMHVKYIAYVATLLPFMCTLAFADRYNVAFVNPEQIYKKSALAVNESQKLEKEFSERYVTLQNTKKNIQALQDLIDSPSLSDTDRHQKELELTELKRKFDLYQSQFYDDLENKKSDARSLVRERANQEIQKMAKTEQLDLILQDAVYISPRLDMTEKVIQSMKK